MVLLILIVAVCVLLGGFLLLTRFELAHGTRVLESERTKFDRLASRAIILMTHVDYGSFFRHLTKDVLHKMAHDTVEATLALVRFLERTLSGTMRSLRSRLEHPHVEMRKEGSHFVKTMTYFKKTMRKSHKEDVEITTPLPPVGE